MAENSHLTFKYLTPELFEYLDATILTATTPEEAFRKYDDLANKHIDVLRKLTKQIQDARIARDNEMIKKALKEYDEALEVTLLIHAILTLIHAVQRSLTLSNAVLTLHDVAPPGVHPRPDGDG
jgi:DNA polymerase III gamma/tau subunit